MQFEREFFLDEVRDGFFVPGMMKRQWAICIEDYRQLVNVCDEHGLMCMAAWGTLIGAIRHGGFVPWDDDVDMEMLREDFEDLVSYVGKEEKKGQYHIDDFMTAKNTNMVRRWMEKTVMIYEPERWGERHGFPFGNAIDVFVLDNIPQEEEKFKEYLRVIYLCETLRTDYLEIGNKEETQKMKKKLQDLSLIVGYPVKVERDQYEGVQLFKVLDDYHKRVSINSKDDKTSEYRRASASQFIKSRNFIAPNSETYSGLIEVPFENTTIPVPFGYDGLLRQLYGVYVTPVHVFGNHMYPSYDSLRNPLKDEYDFELLTYHFDLAKYKKVSGNRDRKKPLSVTINERITLFKEAHEYIRAAICGEMSDEKIDEIRELLGQCQELAVDLGEMIERKTDNHANAISVLERYCEAVFSLFEGVGGDDGLSDHIDAINECEESFSGNSFNELVEIKEIVFLVDRAENWGSLHTIWEEAKKEENTRVVVIAVPYVFKDEYGMIPEGVWETDADKMPNEVELTPYDQYDFELRHPDMIIYQNPYDAYNDTISIIPSFYSENICRFTDEMVFIPPFVLREILPEDNRGRYTLGVFLRNPGLVYADSIIVQSEDMAKVYTQILSEMSEDEIDWKSRIIGIGSGVNDHNSRKKRTKYLERRQICDEPRILFYVGASMLYDNGVPALERKIETFEYIEKRERKERPFNIIVYRDPYAERILKDLKPETYKAYDEWLHSLGTDRVVANTEIGMVGLTDKYDAFYGDGGVLLNEFRVQGKPFLWERPGLTYIEENIDGFLDTVIDSMIEPEETDDGIKIWQLISE